MHCFLCKVDTFLMWVDIFLIVDGRKDLGFRIDGGGKRWKEGRGRAIYNSKGEFDIKKKRKILIT